MIKKGILLLNYEDKSRKLNYAVKPDGKIVVITSGKSNKVAYMKAHQEVELEIDNVLVKATPSVIEDDHVIKSNFDFLTHLENNHFDAYNDIFVTVEFSLKSVRRMTMEVLARRSLPGLLQLWATVVLPPVFIVIYLYAIGFDLSSMDVAYWIIGGILLVTSIFYLILFGKTMFLPQFVIEKDGDRLTLHTGLKHDYHIDMHDIVDVIAVKSAKMSFLRLNPVSRTYGKLIVKTMDKTYTFYPIAAVDEVKKQLEKLKSSH